MNKVHMKTNIGQYVIIIKDKKLLLLYPSKGDLLMFAGGRLDSDEDDYKESLKREVKEETDLVVQSIEPFDIKMWSVQDKKHRYAVFFLCEIEDLNKEIKLSHEHVKYKWFTYDESINADDIGEPGKEVIQKLRDKGYL